MRFAPIFLTAFVLAPTSSAAQDSELNALLFERSYAGIGSPSVIGAPSYYDAAAEPSLLAEAQIAPHLTLYRGLVLDEVKYGTGRGFNLFVTPQIRLRGYDVPSAPVRNLSFMPKFTLQWLWARGQNSEDELAPGTRRIYGLNLIVGHHSNGGATCEFVDEEQDEDGECVFEGAGPLPSPLEREVRIEDGNFSTNYIELGAGYRHGVTSSSPVEHWRWFLEGAASYQHHHDWVGLPLPGGPDEVFGELYGLDRLRFDLAGHWLLSERFALRGNARLDLWSAAAERFAGARDFTLESDLYVQYLPDIGDGRPGILGLGIRYSRGQDYYNTQFVKDISHLQLALFVDLWSPVFDD
jgi:hypothetical protein